MMYVADIGSDCSAYPRDIEKRAEMNRWLLWEASVWFHSCYTFVVEYFIKPSQQLQLDQKVLDEELVTWNILAKILDDHFATRKWLCGESVTIADIAVAASMHLWPRQKMPVDEFPNLKR
jgi:glutathione S-transferase